MKKAGIFLLILAVGLLLSACSSADSADCSNLPATGVKIKIDSAWSRTAEEGSGTSAAYMVISNCGTEPDALLSAATAAAESTQVHVTKMDNGVMTMGEVQKIDIPAGKKVELKQGSYHIMMMKLKQNINAGDPVEIVLTFDKAGEIKVTAPARNP